MKNILKHLRSFLSFSNHVKFICPVCGGEDVAFTPLPEIYEKRLKEFGALYSMSDLETLNCDDYSCSSCGASDRDRLYAIYMSRYLEQSDETKINLLDIAPIQPLVTFLEGTGKVNIRTADLLKQGVDDCVDVMDMNCYADMLFDFFICSHVLEHVRDDSKALSELFRVLRPGGSGILMVPILLSATEIDEDPDLENIGERWRRFGQNDHLRMYSKQGFIERVEDAGFEIDQLGIDYFGKSVFRKHGITNKSVLYVVSILGKV